MCCLYILYVMFVYFICNVCIYIQEEQHVFRVIGESKSHIMYIGGGEPLTPEVESLSVLPPEEAEEG